MKMSRSWRRKVKLLTKKLERAAKLRNKVTKPRTQLIYKGGKP